MKQADLHIHSCFCDGKDTPEDIVQNAIAKGMREIGILTHSNVFSDEEYRVRQEKFHAFIAEISRLKEKYSGRIGIRCGVEQDLYSFFPTDHFDYVIGSQHFIKRGEKYYPVDNNEKTLLKIVEEVFDGDFFELAKEYYRMEKEIIDRTGAGIIGHFDLITKFNEGGRLFDTSDERYVSFWKETVDHLLPYGVPFEINTGAISRGYRTLPYPEADIISYIKEKGGKLILSSDSHWKETVGFMFEEFEYLLK
ncbi:MAG: histidinol-phosphatase HisJ family protein [Anaerolineaceae bacterium]|nr:histidinol-phosphatase HisJ family protein [Anaerolineaceae bacterium]